MSLEILTPTHRVRSRALYVNEGEKCSAYFFSLEKRRYNEKNMKAVYTDDGRLNTNQKTIHDEITKFYKELYKENTNVHFSLKPEKNESLLSEVDKHLLEQPLEPDEFFDAVMTLKNNKVPGLDRLTVEFYRKFWKKLSPFLIRMYNYSFQNGTLPDSVRQGLISLLSKRNKNPAYVRNRRPLTILNNNFKILSKALDNRNTGTAPGYYKVRPDWLC